MDGKWTKEKVSTLLIEFGEFCDYMERIGVDYLKLKEKINWPDLDAGSLRDIGLNDNVTFIHSDRWGDRDHYGVPLEFAWNNDWKAVAESEVARAKAAQEAREKEIAQLKEDTQRKLYEELKKKYG